MSRFDDRTAHSALEAAAEERQKARVFFLANARPVPERNSSAGCTGACEWAEPCNCSHSHRPRQPRRSLLRAPRQPQLSLLRRLALALQRLCAGIRWGR